MPRRLRIHLRGGFYHVTLRGNHQQPVFRVTTDRHLLNAIVAKSLDKCGARLHAFCWMTNHLHFLLQVSDDPLGGLMREIASNYARAFQKNLQTSGHLFERRYHATLVDADPYLLELLRYIHLNPVRGGITRRAAQYPWSSHHAYAGGVGPPWLTTDFILPMFAPERGAAHAAYCSFIALSQSEQVVTDGTLAKVAILGSEEFVARATGASRGSAPAVGHPRLTLDDLLAQACERFVIDASALLSDARAAPLVEARAWFARQATEQRAASLSAVARFLKRDRATLRHAMQKYGAADEKTGKMDQKSGI